jgi:hypothetical protein
VTTYAYQSASRQLLAVWPVGIGQRAEVVADADHLLAQYAQGLCYRLTRLSECLWDTYVRPVSLADGGDLEELWRREEARDSFELVLAALYIPNLPDEQGVLEVSGVAIEDYAHALGRLLYSIADAALTGAVAAEVGREMRAVELAGRGDFSGRAAQAVVLDRLDVSPAQVAAADRMFWDNPLGSADLLTSVDPVAACVAAAHWLAAAATVAAEASGVDTALLFGTAERRTAPVTVPALVVRAVLAGRLSPYLVVHQLLRQGIAAKEGRIPDIAVLLDDIAAARRQARAVPKDVRGEVLANLLPHRTTPLDPMRPTRDLLEHLLDGIRSCLVVLAQHVDQRVAERGGRGYGPSGLPAGVEAGGTNDADNADPILEEFVVSVRQVATTRRERLA